MRVGALLFILLSCALLLSPRLLRNDEDIRVLPVLDDHLTNLDPPSPPAEEPTPAPRPATSSGSNDDASGGNRLDVGGAQQLFELRSPSGRFVFGLSASGQLELSDSVTGEELFVSDTDYFWPVEWDVELTHDGVLKLSWTNQTEQPYRATPWVSSLLPDCDPVPSLDEPPVLELLDSGLLHIRSGSKTTCVLRRAAGDKGRLAIVYAGFLRTYLANCAEHKAKLVDSWTGTGGADVHVFAYYEDVIHNDGEPVTKATVEKHLKQCFGEALKTVELHKLKDIKENAAKPSKKLLESCDQEKLNRHLSQWKALYLVGQQVRRYMVEHGVAYDYIYKGRLDLQLWGLIPPLSSLSLPPSGIVAPRVAHDWTWYSMLHTGEQRAGVTDITAFGRTAQMLTYLALYREFLSLRTEEKEVGKWKAFNSKARVKVSDGQEPCTPEGILAYWLHLNGISVKTDWRFGMGLLRGDGNLIFTCPTGRDFMCPGFIPHAADDGTLY